MGSPGGRIACRVCEAGELVRRRVYRLSGCVVALGWAILLSSGLGVLLGVLAVVAGAEAGAEAIGTTEAELELQLVAAGFEAESAQRIASGERPTEHSLAALAREDRRLVESVLARRAGSEAGAALGAGLAVSLGAWWIGSALLGVLLGLVLTMRRRVLECSRCGATIAAS